MQFGSRLLAGLLRPVLHYVSRSRLPQTSGKRVLSGLDAPVTIRRDRWGIPHIHAATRSDLFFAQGFVHAQDRLWQMELNRRAAAGRVAEMVGIEGVETDRLARTLGFRRLAETTWATLSAGLQNDLTAYAAGVNAYFRDVAVWPVEFSLLRHTPQPWEPLDSLAFARLQLWTLSLGWAGELVRAQLVEKVGADAAAELEPRPDPRQPASPAAAVDYAALSDQRLQRAAVLPFLGHGADGSGKGSNGWLVAARRTAGGSALLCNDMHLPMPAPGIWYFNHLRAADGFHVTGVSQPGLPYVLIGHNEHVAWGATLAFTDVEDLFVERFHADGSGRYRFRNEWRQATIHDELIQVRGAAPLRERVLVTHHGPVISPLLNGDGQPAGSQALALASMALQPENGFDGFPRLNEAVDWETFVAAAEAIAAPSLNLLYADRQNNIGRIVTGRVPIRRQGHGLLPAPGWNGDHEWEGVVPPADMPRVLNPATGRLVSCNQAPETGDTPFLGAVWASGSRARRVTDLLNGKAQVTDDDCARIQQDLFSAPAAALTRLIAGFEFQDPDARLGQQLLADWNGWLATSVVGGSIYAVFLRELARLMLEPALGRPLLERLLGLGVHETLAPVNEFFGHWADTAVRLLQAEQSVWVGGRLGREALVEQALAATVATLREKRGPDPRHWTWGELHRIRFRHLLGSRPALDAVFSLGPYPIGGDVDTVLQSSVRPGDSFDCNAVGVSFRQIIDVGDWERCRGMLAPGQSGHLASAHYGDLIEPWLAGRYFAMHWSEKSVADSARETLLLQPAAAPPG